jgi:hypothetical protein
MKRTLNEIYSSDQINGTDARYTEVDILEAYTTGFVAGYREGYCDADNGADDDLYYELSSE